MTEAIESHSLSDASATDPSKSEKDGTDVHVEGIAKHTDAVTDHKVAFLATFSPEEQKKIMKKVDNRLLYVIALLSLLKNVRCSILFHPEGLLTANEDRCFQCGPRKGPTSWKTNQYINATPHDV